MESETKYLVRVNRINKESPDEFPYDNRAFAGQFLNMFLKDESGLYRNIALLSEKNGNLNVERILVFENGFLRMDLSDCDIVRLREGFRSSGEEKYLYMVKNIHEDTERCLICCLNSKLTLGSSEMVDLKMIDRVCSCRDLANRADLDLEINVPENEEECL